MLESKGCLIFVAFCIVIKYKDHVAQDVYI